MANGIDLDLIDRTRGKNRTDLARQIQITIKNFTHGRPMPAAEIIATMAFCVGTAIGNQPKEVDKRTLVELSAKYVAIGEQSASEEKEQALVDTRAIKL